MVVGAFNQEKAQVGSFSVIVKTVCETDGSSAALLRTAPIEQNANVCKSPQEDQVTGEEQLQVQDDDLVVVGGKLLPKLCKVIVLTIIRYQTLLPTI